MAMDYMILCIMIFIISVLLTRKKEKIFNSESISLRNLTKFNKYQNRIFFIAISSMLFLTAFRAITVGTDTKTYTSIFLGIIKHGQIDWESHIEYGYQFLCLLVGKVSVNPQAIFIVTATLTYFLVGFFFYKNIENKYSIVILFAILFYSFFLSGVRQALAMAILLYAYKAIENNKEIKACIIILIAASIHTVSYAFLLLVVLKHIKLTKKRIFFFLGLALIFAVFGERFLEIFKIVFAQYAGYLNSARVGTGWLAVTLELSKLLCIGFVYLLVTNPKERKNVELWLLLLSVGFMLCAYIMNLFDRVSYSFQLPLCCVLTNRIYRSKRIDRWKWELLLIIYMLFAFIITIILRIEWLNIFPYKFFWGES